MTEEVITVVHVRAKGMSMDIPMAELGDVGTLSSDSVMLEAVRAALAGRGINADMAGYMVDRMGGGIIIRPAAVFGGVNR